MIVDGFGFGYCVVVLFVGNCVDGVVGDVGVLVVQFFDYVGDYYWYCFGCFGGGIGYGQLVVGFVRYQYVGY